MRHRQNRQQFCHFRKMVCFEIFHDIDKYPKFLDLNYAPSPAISDPLTVADIDEGLIG